MKDHRSDAPCCCFPPVNQFKDVVDDTVRKFQMFISNKKLPPLLMDCAYEFLLELSNRCHQNYDDIVTVSYANCAAIHGDTVVGYGTFYLFREIVDSFARCTKSFDMTWLECYSQDYQKIAV